MKSALLVVLAGLALVLASCEAGIKSGRGFTLPEGDVASGKNTFLQLQCNACHFVAGDSDIVQSDNATLNIRLGGEVKHLQTYGQLVTSIINPSHRLVKGYPVGTVDDDGESRMKNYNDVMTVRQLVDLVTYLQVQYELIPFEPTSYPMYH